MTRRDYVLIAGVLKSLGQDEAHCFDNEEDRTAIAMRFADALSAENPAFDGIRFIQATIPNA